VRQRVAASQGTLCQWGFLLSTRILLLPAFLLLLCSGCGRLFEDNATHLAYALEKGAAQLRTSNAAVLIVHFETLDNVSEPYYVELTPSLGVGQTSNIWGSYLVVSGKTSGGTSYHNRFVFVPRRLYLTKDRGGSMDIVLRKDDGRIVVVELQ
jgi:hypothetical protein